MSILVSFEKYGKNQAISAIIHALKGDYSFFSRIGYDNLGNEFQIRNSLQTTIPPEKLKKSILENNPIYPGQTLDDIVRNYVDNIIYKHKGCIFEEALYATAEKHNDNKDMIERRINSYSISNNINMFSVYNANVRPNYNFRESVVKNISPQNVYAVIESILYNKKIEYSTNLNNENVSNFADLILSRFNSKKY